MIFIVTSTEICSDNFLTRMEKIAMARPDRVIFKEENMPEKEYRTLAYDCQAICRLYDVDFSVNSHISIAKEVHSDIHLSLPELKKQPEIVKQFRTVGVSVRNKEEAEEAQQLGASYIIAENICSAADGETPNGFEFLQNIVFAVSIPVLASGGITKERTAYVYANGASGVCSVSHFMECNMDEIENDIFYFKNT